MKETGKRQGVNTTYPLQHQQHHREKKQLMNPTNQQNKDQVEFQLIVLKYSLRSSRNLVVPKSN